jgi:hypothetical protein
MLQELRVDTLFPADGVAADPTSLRVPSLVQQSLDAFVAGLRDRFGPRLKTVRLFGPYARGTATEDSDVDCLVLLDHVSPEDDSCRVDGACLRQTDFG